MRRPFRDLAEGPWPTTGQWRARADGGTNLPVILAALTERRDETNAVVVLWVFLVNNGSPMAQDPYACPVCVVPASLHRRAQHTSRTPAQQTCGRRDPGGRFLVRLAVPP
jgi:hypothetical protein